MTVSVYFSGPTGPIGAPGLMGAPGQRGSPGEKGERGGNSAGKITGWMWGIAEWHTLITIN